MGAATLQKFCQMIGVEHGLILVTGPTGSGKSTTLYSALQELNTHERNVLTLEDPIEYQLEGVSQTQINTKKHCHSPAAFEAFCGKTRTSSWWANASQIRETAIQNGINLLRHNGLSKAAEGITTLDEVSRATLRTAKKRGRGRFVASACLSGAGADGDRFIQQPMTPFPPGEEKGTGVVLWRAHVFRERVLTGTGLSSNL